MNVIFSLPEELVNDWKLYLEGLTYTKSGFIADLLIREIYLKEQQPKLRTKYRQALKQQEYLKFKALEYKLNNPKKIGRPKLTRAEKVKKTRRKNKTDAYSSQRRKILAKAREAYRMKYLNKPKPVIWPIGIKIHLCDHGIAVKDGGYCREGCN
jgi:hypothetical protein